MGEETGWRGYLIPKLYLLLMLIFFILERYFSAHAVRPVMKAWDLRQQFIADSSHELKTSISTLSTNLDVLNEF